MNKHLTTEDLDRIEKAARPIAEDGAGHWETAIDEDLSHPGPVVVLAGTEDQVCGSDFEGYRTCLSDEDAEHIAAADPATVLALAAEVRRLRALPDNPEAVERAARELHWRDLDGYWATYAWEELPEDECGAYLYDGEDVLRIAQAAALNSGH